MPPRRTSDIAPKAERWFKGFQRPNTTGIPNEFFDVLLPRLTESELRVLLYILRHTFGYQKDYDKISLKQIADGITSRAGRQVDLGCGLSYGSVRRGLRGLLDQGIIVRRRNIDPHGGTDASTYAPAFDGDPLSASEQGYQEETDPLSTPEHPPLLPHEQRPVHSRAPQRENQQNQTNQKEPPSTPPEGDGGQEALLEVPEHRPEERVWASYLDAIAEYGLNPNSYDLTEQRRKLIRQKLQERSLEDLLAATHGWLYSAYHCGRNDSAEEYIGIEVVLSINSGRDNIERFRNLDRQARAEGWQPNRHLPKSQRRPVSKGNGSNGRPVGPTPPSTPPDRAAYQTYYDSEQTMRT